jgi:hypothetical protein
MRFHPGGHPIEIQELAQGGPLPGRGHERGHDEDPDDSEEEPTSIGPFDMVFLLEWTKGFLDLCCHVPGGSQELSSLLRDTFSSATESEFLEAVE